MIIIYWTITLNGSPKPITYNNIMNIQLPKVATLGNLMFTTLGCTCVREYLIHRVSIGIISSKYQ